MATALPHPCCAPRPARIRTRDACCPSARHRRLADHARPQEDRDHVHGLDLHLLPARRPRRAPGARAAGAARVATLRRRAYNQIFTIHASVMIFLFIIPFGIGGLGNYLVPLMIGARDMAFPKINALSFWMILPGGLLILSGFFFPDPTGKFPRAPPTRAGRPIRRSACARPSVRACGWSACSSWARRRFLARSTSWSRS